MSINVIDSFISSMNKFLDDRMKYDSLEALQNDNETIMPKGFIVYCKKEDKWYKLSCTNENDPITYQWNEFGVGGTGLDETELVSAVNKNLVNKSISVVSGINHNEISPNLLQSTFTLLNGTMSLDKTIDTTSGELIDSVGTYVTDFIKVKDDNGNILIDKVYVNEWSKSDLLWVGYGKDKTTVIKTGVGGTSHTPLQRAISVGSFSNIYYIRVVGYTSLCDSTSFVVTDCSYKTLDWMLISPNNINGRLSGDLCQNDVCRLRTDDCLDVTITPIKDSTTDSKITIVAAKDVVGYINYSPVKLSPKDTSIEATLVPGDYALAYDLDNKTINVKALSEVYNNRYLVLSYIYLNKQNRPLIYMGNNDNKINFSWTYKTKDTTITDRDVYVEITEKLYDCRHESSFVHNIYPNSPDWLKINKVGVNKFETPYPFVFNSTVKAEGGMVVSQNGLCSMYHTLDKGHGGHSFQGWASNGEYRSTIINDNRMSDNLPVTSIQNWVTKGMVTDTDCAYGWIHLGCDSYTIVDEIVDNSNTLYGIYINPKVSIIGTPMIMEPKPLLTSMPQGYEVDSNGNYVIDDTGKKTKKALESIENKDILQVNEAHELCFHSAADNKWYKVNMTEIN